MLDWQHAGFKCIRQRPRSSTAKTKGAEGTYPNVVFDFLGYQFRPRRVANTQRDEFFCGFTPAVSPTALKSMRATIESLNIPRQTPGTLAEIAQQLNPLLRGWIAYYGPLQPFGAVHSG